MWFRPRSEWQPTIYIYLLKTKIRRERGGSEMSGGVKMKINTPNNWRRKSASTWMWMKMKRRQLKVIMVSETDESKGGKVEEELSPRRLSRHFFWGDADSGFLAEMLDGIGTGPTASPHPGCFRNMPYLPFIFLTFTQIYLFMPTNFWGLNQLAPIYVSFY